jgi:hypothetical protein
LRLCNSGRPSNFGECRTKTPLTNIDYYDDSYYDGLMDIYIEATELGAQPQGKHTKRCGKPMWKPVPKMISI